MILDKLSEAARYEALNPLFGRAFEFLRNSAELPIGRHELGGGMYANIMDVTTHAAGEGRFEAHRKYIDIQYLVSGRSACVWAHTPQLETETPYDEESDVLFLTGEGTEIPVQAGEFYILYPADAHEPHRTHGEQASYRAVVVKVPVE